MVTMGIAPGEARRLNTPCDVTDFQGVLEIPVNEITPGDRTHIAIDLTDANGTAIITPGSRIIRQTTFKDAFPWLLVTMFETGEP
jgi:hypothetical protein